MRSTTKQKTKYSGVEWIGNIPENWRVQKLKTIIQTTKNGAWGADPVGDLNDIVCIRVADFDKEHFGISVDNLTTRNIENYQKLVLEKNDLIFEKSGGGDSQLVGRIVLFNQDIKAVTSNFLSTIRLKKGLANPNFFYYLLKHYYNSSVNYKSIKQTTGIQNIDADAYFQELIPLPDLTTQKSISDYLDIKTKQVKKFADDKNKLIELLQEQKKNIIYNAVTKGLIKKDNTKSSGIKGLSNIPYEWRIVPLSKYFISKVDYRGKTPEKVDFSGKILITTRNIRDGKITYDKLEYITDNAWAESRERGTPAIGDFVFTMEAPLGEVAIIDDDTVAFGQRIIKFKIDDKYFNSDYLLYLMRSYFFTYQLSTEATGSTALGLKASKIHKLKAIQPPLDEQKQIVDYLNVETLKIDKAIHTVQQEIELIEEYKKSLIYQAVTGKIETLLTNK